jgi:hypothetical protein
VVRWDCWAGGAPRGLEAVVDLDWPRVEGGGPGWRGGVALLRTMNGSQGFRSRFPRYALGLIVGCGGNP